VHDFYQEASEERGWVLFEQDGALDTQRKAQSSGLSETWWRQCHSLRAHPMLSLLKLSGTPSRKLFVHAPISLPHSTSSKSLSSEAWDEIPLEEVDKHIATMNEEDSAVMAADRGHKILITNIFISLLISYLRLKFPNHSWFQTERRLRRAPKNNLKVDTK